MLPTWLSVIIAGCALAIAVVEFVVRAGFWAGRVEQRSTSGNTNDQVAHDTLVLAKLEAIHADTTHIRQKGHEIANQLTVMKGLEQDIREDLRGRRGRT